MRNFAINHMTAAEASFEALLSTAVECGCTGIELRNDLSTELFDGLDPESAAEMVSANGLKIFALAEVKPFNRLTAQTIADTELLSSIAQRCGSQAIALIPANDGANGGRNEESRRKQELKLALLELIPILEHHGVMGFVEPLGFDTASLRSKREVVEVIEELNAQDRVKLVHDTFHHYLAREPEFYPEHTGMVHISGVTDPNLSVNQMQDSHRVLVNSEDRLHNTAQLAALADGGYTGPVSVEAFATEVHQIKNLAESLRGSFQFINSGLASKVA